MGADQPGERGSGEHDPAAGVVRTRRYLGTDDGHRDDVSADDRDLGWGDPGPSERGDDWYQRERPPHHG